MIFCRSRGNHESSAGPGSIESVRIVDRARVPAFSGASGWHLCRCFLGRHLSWSLQSINTFKRTGIASVTVCPPAWSARTPFPQTVSPFQAVLVDCDAAPGPMEHPFARPVGRSEIRILSARGRLPGEDAIRPRRRLRSPENHTGGLGGRRILTAWSPQCKLSGTRARCLGVSEERSQPIGRQNGWIEALSCCFWPGRRSFREFPKNRRSWCGGAC
jgi:hypothetical protein